MASPELKMVLDMLGAMWPPQAALDVQQQRAQMEQATTAMPPPADVTFEAVSAGGVPGEWTQAPGASRRNVLLYVHGGGYCIGSIATHRLLVSEISRASGAAVLSLDYRLAPEHPWPAAVDDATAAYRWLLSQGLAANQLAIGGDSAGGGLTVATLLALRDAGTPLPAAGVCLSPWVDLTQSGASMTTKAAVDPMVQRDRLEEMAQFYAGANRRAPLVSPLFGDLKGLPPLLVQVGTAETLLDDSTRLAEKARRADVDVTLEPWDDMIHVWQAFSFILPEARQAIARIGEYLKGRWAR